MDILPRNRAIAALRPNPMSIMDAHTQEILEKTLLSPYSHVVNDVAILSTAHPFTLLNAAHTISVLHQTLRQKAAEGKSRILFNIHRTSTAHSSIRVAFDGTVSTIPDCDGDKFRQYFDGFKVTSQNLGHIALLSIDFDVQSDGNLTGSIIGQDSQGIAMPDAIISLLETHLPNFKFTDMQLKQQWDSHSCSIINMYNKECFAAGRLPIGQVDTDALRMRYWSTVDDQLRAEGVRLNHETRFYNGTPPCDIPYTPI